MQITPSQPKASAEIILPLDSLRGLQFPITSKNKQLTTSLQVEGNALHIRAVCDSMAPAIVPVALSSPRDRSRDKARHHQQGFANDFPGISGLKYLLLSLFVFVIVWKVLHQS